MTEREVMGMKGVSISIRLSQEEHEELKASAIANDRTKSDQARLFIKRALAEKLATSSERGQ
jgi:hypothetical protein